MQISQIVERGASELGIELPPGASGAFEKYHELLEEKGECVNLTAITGAEDVARLHFLDSLALLKATDFKSAKVIDVGSGAGFPGVPLKLADPTVSLTVLDATGKRVAFLSDLCAGLGVDAVCIHARAEDAARTPELRERFDVAASRAVARLNVLCELCLPFVRVGGAFLAMKGVDSAEELEQARNAIEALGATFESALDYAIPCTEIRHRVVVLRKTAPTPERYPRRFSRMRNSPL